MTLDEIVKFAKMANDCIQAIGCPRSFPCSSCIISPNWLLSGTQVYFRIIWIPTIAKATLAIVAGTQIILKYTWVPLRSQFGEIKQLEQGMELAADAFKTIFGHFGKFDDFIQRRFNEFFRGLTYASISAYQLIGRIGNPIVQVPKLVALTASCGLTVYIAISSGLQSKSICTIEDILQLRF